MASASCSDFTSTHPAENEHEVYDLIKTVKISEVPVVPTKKRVLRLSFVHKRDKITKLLVKTGVIVETSFLFKSPLYYAVRVGDIKLVKMLILEGADVNSPRRKGTSPLHVAAWRGHHKIVKLLIQNGARVDSVLTGPIKNGFTPLHLACLNNKVKCVKVLLKYGASVTPKYENIYHPIHIAVFNNYVEVTKLLLDNGADVNLRFNNEFFNKKWKNKSFWKDMDLTLLLCSIARKYKDMTKLLLKYGADIHLKTRKDKTSLMYAVQASDPELVELFLAKGANPNDRDLCGEPVLFYLILNANMYPTPYNKEELDLKDEKIKIMQLLIDAGGDINAIFSSRKPYDILLNCAVVFGQRKLVNYILFATDFDYRDIDYTVIQRSKIYQEGIIPSIQDDVDFIEHLKTEFKAIAYEMISYILSRYIIGFPVKKELISKIEFKLVCDSTVEEYAENLDCIQIKINKSITYLKQTMIGNTKITFWHILSSEMEELVRLSFNREVRNLCLRDYCKDVYWYYKMLKDRLDTAIKRSTLIEKAREIGFDLFYNYLPYDCCEIIVRRFDDKELEDFITLCNDGNLLSLD